jgi:serine/threonine protein kinase/tetratricopeptide (TPR) repeat protein
MNPEAQRVRNIFVAAVKVPPDQWEPFLKGACAGDEELCGQVSDLLREHQQAGNFLDRPAILLQGTSDFGPAADGVAAGAQEGAGTTIGPYKLLELIGEGGMGAVWMAEQREPVQRRVALKIIKAGMDTRQVVARFEAERQALALMDHPNIARVFDGGTTAGGRPYFVMELVKGVPITRYCDEHRLTPRERLELFLPVCQAIQHAHTKGIIHRDVKPANVLVAPYDGRPVPKVIDFGVAKATGQRLTPRTLVTGFGAVVGTLEYMSPEQAELNNQDIDTRSDIYALGVLLYELLTGTTPLTRERLTQAAFTEVLRIIREEEPPRPSTRLSESRDMLPSISARRHMEPARLTKVLRGELDWIVMKALEKDRSRRYETANGLARDVEHYLADEPVQACPPTISYRLGKLVGRHKGPVLAVSLVLLALVAGIIGTTLGLLQARAAAEAERKAREDETAQRVRAEDNAKLATTVLDEIIMKQARQRLTLYSQDKARGLAKNSERDKLEREFLETGLQFYEQLAQTNAADWAARRERAKAHMKVGLLRTGLRNYGGPETAHPAEAEKAYRQAVFLLEELAAERPDDFDNAYDLADAHREHLFPLLYTGRLAEAEKTIRRALDLVDKLATDFPDHRSQIRELSEACQANLALLLRDTGKPLEAQKALQQALEICAEVAPAHPNDPEFWDAVARLRTELACRLQETGQRDEAEREHRQALAIWEKLLTTWPDRYDYQQHAAWACARIGDSRAAAQRPREGAEYHRRALRLFEKLGADYPGEPFYRQEQARGYNALTEILLGLGDHAEAAKIAEELPYALPGDGQGYQRALLLLTRCAQLAEKDEKLPQADRKAVAKTYADRSRALQQNAREAYAQAMSRAEKLVSESPGVARYRDQLAEGRMNLIALLKATGRAQEVEQKYREAVEFYGQLAAAHPDMPELWDALARTHHDLAELFQVTGQMNEAEKAYRQAIALWEKLGTDRPDLRDYRQHAGYTRLQIGNLLKDAGKPQDAEECYRRALALYETLVAEYPAEAVYRQLQANTYWTLATLLKDTGRAQEAEGAYRQAVAIQEQLVADFPDNAEYRSRLSGNLADLAANLLQQGKHAEAEKVTEKRLEGLSWQEQAQYYHQRGRTYEDKGQLPRATVDYHKALELYSRVLEGKAVGAADWYNRGAVYLNLGEWDKASADFTRALALRPEDAWYLHERGFAYLMLHRFPEALADHSKAIELGGKDAGLWARRGQIYCELGQWDKAAADYAKATEMNPNLPLLWYQYAMVRLGAADAKGYRGVCASLLERFGKTEDPDAAYWVAWPCVLVTDAVAQPVSLVPLAEKGVAKAPTNYDYLNTLGAALYRAGRLEEAVKRLAEAAAAYKPDSGCRQPLAYSWFFLAMAHHRLGQAAEARKWLDKAVQWMDQADPEKGKGAANTVPMPWNRRLTLQLLRREAETLIHGAARQK